MKNIKKLFLICESQLGFAPVLILIVVGLLLVVGVYFGLGKFNEFAEKFGPNGSKVTSSPAPSGLTKQQRYEQNKEKIKEQLHLSEQEFQTLKRFSGD